MEDGTRNILYLLIKGQINLACEEVLIMNWPSQNQSKLLFIQIQTPPPIMHQNEKRLSTLKSCFNSTGLLVESWLFCIEHFPCSLSFQCMLLSLALNEAI